MLVLFFLNIHNKHHDFKYINAKLIISLVMSFCVYRYNVCTTWLAIIN